MKKIAMLVLAALLAVSSFAGLAACTPKQPEIPEKAIWELYPDEYDNPNEMVDPSTQPGYNDRKVLRIMSWNFGTEAQNMLNRRMLKQFELFYTDYRVEIVEYTDYTTDLNAMIASKNMPDVVMLNSLPQGLQGRWLLDISSMITSDPDWSNVPTPLQNASKFNGKYYAVPAEMHLSGLYVNDKVFDNANKTTLPVNPTYAQVKKAIKDINEVGRIAGVNLVDSFLEWYAMSKNPNVGHYTWDGAKFNLDSAEFAEGLGEMKTMYASKYAFGSWGENEYQAIQSADALEVFRKNKMGLYFGHSYIRNGIQYGETGARDMLFQGDLRYVGTPGGRNIIIPDIWGISAKTSYPDGAYQLAKWLSFDPLGIDKRLKIDYKQEFISLPLTADTDIIERFFDAPSRHEVEGLKEVFLTLDNAVVECQKVVPSYVGARWDLVIPGKTYNYVDPQGVTQTRSIVTVKDIYDDIWKGTAPTLRWADVVADVNKTVNDNLAASMRSLNEMYPKS